MGAAEAVWASIYPAVAGCSDAPLLRQTQTHARCSLHTRVGFIETLQMIYVEGMPPSATLEEVAEHFGSIGVVKFDKKKNQKKVHHSRALLAQYGG